jgi:hypothetical protein
MFNRNSKQNVGQLVLSRNGAPQLDQRQIFEIDRSIVILQLRTLLHTIEEGGEELELVAAEGVFDKSLSRTLILRARKLHLIARDLNGLLRVLERAKADTPPERSVSKLEQCLRRKARNSRISKPR